MTSEKNKTNIQHSESESTSPMPEEDEINLLDLLLVLLKHKKMIMIVCVATFIGMCGITLLMPNIFVSTARILPPQENSGGLSAALGGMGDLAAVAGISMGGAAGEQYVSMMKSRTISDALIDRFNLMERYEQEYRVKTYKALEEHVNISIGKDDRIIIINVEDEDPHLATDMANAYVEELRQLIKRFNLGTAGRERVFLEERLEMVKVDLVEVEERFKSFQEKNKAIRIDEQAVAVIDAIAALKTELTGKEVELGVMLSYQTEQNPQVKALREAIVQLKSQHAKLEASPTGKRTATDIFITTSEVPELGVQYARLLRNFKIQETLFELLTKQYEMAKINEARDTSTIQVLDEAVVPDRKSKPKRSLIVIVATFAVFMISVFFAFVLEFIHRLKEVDPDRWRTIRNQFLFQKK